MSESITIGMRNGLKGEIKPPGDKSISHRAIMIGSISEGSTEISNFLSGEDCLATIAAFEKMGVDIELKGDGNVRIQGAGPNGLQEPGDVLNMGNSGTSMRLIAGILAGQPFYSVMTGDDSLRRRPMGRIAEPLRLMGAKVYSRKNDLAPLTIIGGNLNSIDYRMPVASAQVKSCILLAGLYAEGETSITEEFESRDHTERMLRDFGAEVESYGLIRKVKGRPCLKGQRVSVPGDISSAAYFIVAAALCSDSEVIIRNTGVNPTRTGIIDALREMGGLISIENYRKTSEPVGDIYVRSSELAGRHFAGDIIVRMIDEIPLLVLAATQADGETVIRDASELRVKESDRIAVTAQEFRKIGASIEELEDGMIITGGKRLKGGRCDSHGDHRMAMALAIAGLLSENGVTIDNIECVNTSFPGFWNMLSAI